MPNFASVTIIGHLGRDSETRTVADTVKVEFSVAVTRKRKDQESTTWFRCAFWGDRAAKISQYLTKGKAVMVQGEIYERAWEKDGKAGKSLEVEVRELVLLGDGGKREPQAEGQDSAPARTAKPAAEDAGADDGRPPF